MEKKVCPKCKDRTCIVENKTHLVYLEYCMSCDFVSNKEMWESPDGYVVCSSEDAVELGLAKICPFSFKICPAWEIDEVGMSIEMWHKKNKGSLTV